ncbi:GNAT family N-acetyltransferase [Shewanella sp. 1CM18E]|uniref:GNAT family N-acetyltransferase n=1 Tax=Shewanella sp. 1CM18E TaxID=2929169 RepID=UPI00249DA9BF|nr:GNAT family N-acetyltransferase [Shewanella sp. 1CM18E]
MAKLNSEKAASKDSDISMRTGNCNASDVSTSDLSTSNISNAAYEIELVDAITKIPAACWNRLMADDNPFNRHEYLSALEVSGSVCTKTGWTPLHLLVKQQGEKAEIVAVMPLYIKAHSYGEYVFDWAWADAYERHQLAYYPKLLSAIPFTPTTGKRLGIDKSRTESEQKRIWQVVAGTLNRCLLEYDFSSWHCLFLPKGQFEQLSHTKSLQRLGTQFHWFNRQYQDFDSFLASLSSRKRKDIKKERAKVNDAQLSFEFIEGAQITAELWQQFYACYQQTYAKRSGHYGYLNQAFFETLGQTLTDAVILLVVSNSEQQLIASALFFKSNTHLYGRYWGALVDVDGLHFEACYYQGIEYCIKHGLQVFDAGAQGEHKVPRGFEPVATYSNHEIAHQEFRQAIHSFTLQEAENIKTYMQQLKLKLPYKSLI